MRQITPNEKVPKSRLLLLPARGDKEGETVVTDAIIEEHEPGIRKELGKILAYVLAGKTVAGMLGRIDSLPREGLSQVLVPMLEQGSLAGVAVTFRLAREAGIVIPVDYAENLVAQWAKRYDYRLVGGIDRNSRAILRKHVSEWAQTGEKLSKLENRLYPWFGPGRSEMIAATEATRAYTEGTFTGWEAAGFNRRPSVTQRPPAHPNCRCFPAMASPEGSDPAWLYVWYTVLDKRVCPICIPKHGEVIGVAGVPNTIAQGVGF
jgi:hypothetical protein